MNINSENLLKKTDTKNVVLDDLEKNISHEEITRQFILYINLISVK